MVAATGVAVRQREEKKKVMVAVKIMPAKVKYPSLREERRGCEPRPVYARG